MPDNDFIPFALPSIGEKEIDAVVKCLRSGWLTSGPAVKQFEQEFAEFVGARYAIAVSSCTAGLHLALEAIGLKTNDRILTSPYTFTATAEVARYLGADVAFADIDATTLNIDPARAFDLIRRDSKIKAIVPVHFAGLPCDMSELEKIARQFDIKIIEDAAHALPAAHRGRAIGSIGDATVFSFYATKTLTTAEGGMLVTNRSDVADRSRIMRLHGISRDVFDRYTSDTPNWYYEVIAPGFKYNMPDVLAAIGRVQLERAVEMSRRREEIAVYYTDNLTDLPIDLPVFPSDGDVHAWHLYVIRLKPEFWGIDRAKFIKMMSEAGIGTSVHFIPLHLQPYWAERYNLTPTTYPVATMAYENAISLPIYPGLTESDISRVVRRIRELADRYAR